MAIVLPDHFQAMRAGGGQIIQIPRFIGEGHPNASDLPVNEIQAMLGNATWLRSKLAQRRPFELTGGTAGHSPTNIEHAEAYEQTDLAAASAVPLTTVAAAHRGVLRFEAPATIAEGRDGANCDLFVDVEHEEGTVNIVVCDRAATVGVHWSHTTTTRGQASTTLAGAINTLGTREVLVRVYMAKATPAAANHKIYSVTIAERHIPASDL